MGWFSDDSSQAQAYNQVTNSTNKASLPHELIAAAASYEAAQAYEKHCAKNGKPPSHAKAKELFAGFAGSYIDRMAETKGLDFVEKEKLQHEASQHAKQHLDSYYT